MTQTGSGKPSDALRSAGAPLATISSISCSAIAAIPGRNAFMRLAVNHLPMLRRHVRCASPCWGITSAMSLLKIPPSSLSAMRAASSAGVGLVNRGSDRICLTSACLVSNAAWSPLASCTCASGHFDRSSAHSAGGSSAAPDSNGNRGSSSTSDILDFSFVVGGLAGSNMPTGLV